MIYYPNIKTLFFASCGTGSRSLNNFFKKINGNESSSIEYNLSTDIPAGTPQDGSTTLVVSVANPYTRVYDRWKRRNEFLTKNNRAGEIVTFAEYVKNGSYNTVQPAVLSVANALAEKGLTPNVLIRLEYIKSDIRLVPAVNLTESNNNHRAAYAQNISFDGAVKRASEWKKEYTQEIADIVYAALEKDFTAYNYNKTSWK